MPTLPMSLADKGKRDDLYVLTVLTVLTVHYKAKRDQSIVLLNVAKKYQIKIYNFWVEGNY